MQNSRLVEQLVQCDGAGNGALAMHPGQTQHASSADEEEEEPLKEEEDKEEDEKEGKVAAAAVVVVVASAEAACATDNEPEKNCENNTPER